jgi:hypothetical protein
MPICEKQKLVTQVVSNVLGVQANFSEKFEWLQNKHTKESFQHCLPYISNIFNLLQGDINANQSKRQQTLNCDAYFGGSYNFIFEFDEFQHFTSRRLTTLEHYPENISLNFSLQEWKKNCSEHRAKADQYRFKKATKDFNFFGGRTAQRAYLDSFRDLLPTLHGLNPTLRISEFETIGITRNDREACQIIDRILKTKLL